ncbi:MAG: uracil-DNA glycosylase [Patescibacteria group bacterium]
MNIRLHDSWKKHLEPEFGQEYFGKLTNFVKQEYQTKKIYPPPKAIFRALDLCPFDEVKVVILGQDPYHGVRQANGLCFSVSEDVAIPPSLQNIYKEIQEDLGKPVSSSGNLERWAKQGVLLLNATLTVRACEAGSHQHHGWETFTDAVIRSLAEQKEHLVFLLWGRYAQEKGKFIDTNKHLVLKAAHPSPFSAYSGFFGCKHFSKTNEYLKSVEKEPVEW